MADDKLQQPPIPLTGLTVPEEVVPEDAIKRALAGRCKAGRCELDDCSHTAFLDEVERLVATIRNKGAETDFEDWGSIEVMQCTPIKHPQIKSWRWWLGFAASLLMIVSLILFVMTLLPGRPDTSWPITAIGFGLGLIILTESNYQLAPYRNVSSQVYELPIIETGRYVRLTHRGELVTYSATHNGIEHDGWHESDPTKMTTPERVRLLEALRKEAQRQ